MSVKRTYAFDCAMTTNRCTADRSGFTCSFGPTAGDPEAPARVSEEYKRPRAAVVLLDCEFETRCATWVTLDTVEGPASELEISRSASSRSVVDCTEVCSSFLPSLNRPAARMTDLLPASWRALAR